MFKIAMSKKIQVIKVPTSKPQADVATNFPRMPRMYLELLENKDKVKPTLVNKEYDPDEAATLLDWDGRDNEQKSDKEDLSIVDEESDADDNDKSSTNDANDAASENSNQESEKSGKHSSRSESEVDESDNEQQSEEQPEEENNNDDESIVVEEEQASESEKPPPIVQSSTRNKIMEMLEAKSPPRLSDLEKRGEVKTEKVVANLNRMTLGSEEEDELKRELLFKFELLKKSYKHVDVPEFTMHSDFQNMNRTYEHTVRRVSLDSNVEQYKSLLIGGFMLIEFVMGVWLKFDMAGFTQQQILNMSQYERLLIELGEKSYVPGPSQWPVEVRLLGLILLNSVIFIISKMIVKKTGNNIVNMMNAFNSTNHGSVARPKRKMKGPNLSVDDLPDNNT
jgi:hypothetical protein